MNSLERSLILKAGYDHGWEVVVDDRPEQIVLASALHHARARIKSAQPSCRWLLTVTPRLIHRELERAEPSYESKGEYLRANNEAEIGRLLDQGARLARTLPDEPCHRFEKALAEELSATNFTTSATEVERLVRQRVGQNT